MLHITITPLDLLVMAGTPSDYNLVNSADIQMPDLVGGLRLH